MPLKFKRNCSIPFQRGLKGDVMQRFLCISTVQSMQGETPAAMEMEVTMGITCTEGNGVGVVAVFGQYLRQKITKKQNI